MAFRKTGTLHAVLPRGQLHDDAWLLGRLEAALHARGATRVRMEDGLVRFRGGSAVSGGHPNFDFDDAALRVRGVAPDLASFRADRVRYVVEYEVRTPAITAVSLVASAAFALAFVLGEGNWLAGLGTSLAMGLGFGAVQRMAVRRNFRRWLDGVLDEATGWKPDDEPAPLVRRPSVRPGRGRW